MSKHHVIYIEAADWRYRETVKEWLATRIGPRGIGWRFMWDCHVTYKVTIFKDEDAVAFKLWLS